MNKSRIDTGEFIKRSILLHNNKYIYSKSVYVSSNKKIIITCPIHGDFIQSADEHMRGRGCKKCGGQKYNSESFINKATEIHNGKYDYSLVNYIKSSEKIKIICSKHGVFEQIANSHLQRQGCLKCSGSEKSNSADFITKSKKIHGDRYDYSNINYLGNKIEVEIICSKHGVFFQKPNGHLSGQGCPKCAGVGRTTFDFIIDASEVHDNKYDYSNVVFEKYNKKINIICPLHGEFEQKPYIHLMRSGCQKCSESKGEKKIALILSKNNVIFDRQKQFGNCINPDTGRHLKFDFYLSKYNLCIEYDGEYHYEPWRLYWDKNIAQQKFDEMKLRDEIKTTYCKNSDIDLLRIPYFELKKIEEIISNYLLKKELLWQ